jgi:hypothetical protein
VDPELAAGLQALLAFEEGTGSIDDVFGVTFTASANPLISSDGEVSGDTVASGEKGAIQVRLTFRQFALSRGGGR